jgi:hypothetical protein
MKIKNASISKNSVLVYIKNTWYGFRWFWQSYPLFGIINMHRKCNTTHYYGIIFFGFNLYWYIDK